MDVNRRTSAATSPEAAKREKISRYTTGSEKFDAFLYVGWSYSLHIDLS